MGHKSQVRLITTKEGFNILKQMRHFINDDYLPTVLENTTIKKEFGKVIYLGWDNVYLAKETLIKESVIDLEEHDVPYTLSILGEYQENELEEFFYNSKNKEIKELPFPSVIRNFDEKDIEEQLSYYKKDIKNTKQVEEIEYE